MKIHRLSSAAERITGICICAVLILCMAFLVIALSADFLSFLICLLASLLVCAGLIFYVSNLFRAACIPHPAGRKLEIKGFPDYSVDLTEAVSLQTAPYKNGPGATRTLMFTNSKDEVVASIPTFFTANQGAQAEPLAMELAKDLDLSFIPTLDPWEYDAEKRKEHMKEVAAQEKAARREKFRALKAKILRMAGAGEPAPTQPEEEVPDIICEESEEAYDGINYDAMDDKK